MHYAEVNILGVYVAPFAPIMVVAWLLCWPLFRLLERLGIERLVWHPALFNAAIYSIVLCLLVLLDGVIGWV